MKPVPPITCWGREVRVLVDGLIAKMDREML